MARSARIQTFRPSSSPIIRIATPRAIVTRKQSKRRRSSNKCASRTDPLRVAMGAALYGYLIKSGMLDKLPTVPLLGRAGTIAVIAHFAAKSNVGGTMMREVAIISATIAGYQLGNAGSISGDDGTVITDD